jgi:hypothetical protein
LRVLGALDILVLERTLILGRSIAFTVIRWGRCAPCTTKMRQIGHEIIQELLSLNMQLFSKEQWDLA